MVISIPRMSGVLAEVLRWKRFRPPRRWDSARRLASVAMMRV